MVCLSVYFHRCRKQTWASLVAQLVKNPPACMYQFDSWVERSPGEGKDYPHQYSWASLVTQTVKNLPAMWETWVRFLGGEDPLEEGIATHSSIFAWRIPMDRGAWWAIVHRVTKGWIRMSHFHFHFLSGMAKCFMFILFLSCPNLESATSPWRLF